MNTAQELLPTQGSGTILLGDALDRLRGGGRGVKRVPCEIYSRVVGYFRPVKNWNVGKRAEFHDRKVYDIAKAKRHAIVHGEGKDA